MKNIISLLTIALLFTSCGNKSQTIDDIIASKDKTAIEGKRNELVQTQHQIADDLEKIEAELS
ncbi:MAG: hypothetical protein P8X62_06805 [Flavobacteriaceae bacterium]